MRNVKINERSFGQTLVQTETMLDTSTIKTENRKVSIIPMNPNKMKHAEPRFSMTRYTAPGGIVYGIPTKLRPDGTFECQRITFEGARHYDLNMLRDAIEFYIVSNHESVKGSKFSNGIPPAWQIDDQVEKAQSYLDKTKKANKLELIVLEMPDAKAKDLARALLSSGNSKNSEVFALDNTDITRRRIIEEIRANPKSFYTLMSDQKRLEASVIFYRSLSTNIITESLESGILHNGKLLGYNRTGAIESISKDPKLMLRLDHESRSREGVAEGLATEEIINDEDAKAMEMLTQFSEKFPSSADNMITNVTEQSTINEDLSFLDNSKTDDLDKDNLKLDMLIAPATEKKAKKNQSPA
jgi:hypothetical protein